VYGEGVLRTFVSRAVWWFKGKSDYIRYEYPKDTHVTDYLFGWEECRQWSDLTLVENTFNAIWLRDALHCTTNFGSSLSATQVALICASKVRKVTFIWDFGTRGAVQGASQKLESRGIETRVVTLSKDKPQPDDYTLEELKCLE